MVGTKAQRSVENIFGHYKPHNRSQKLNITSLLENENLVNEISAGGRLQDHLDNLHKLFLKEECISKNCHVKIARLSHKEKIKAINIKQSSLRQHSSAKKKRNPERRINKTHSNIVNTKHLSQPGVTSLTVTIPRIRKKKEKERVTSDNDTKENVNADRNTNSSLYIDCKNKNSEELKNTKSISDVKKPVLIPLRTPKHSVVEPTQQIRCNNAIYCIDAICADDQFNLQLANELESYSELGTKSRITNNDSENIQNDTEAGRDNSRQQIDKVSGNLKNRPDPDYMEGYSKVSFGTPSLEDSPFIPRNIITQNKLEVAKRWKIKWNNNARSEKKKKSSSRRWKEHWTVRLNTSYGDSIDIVRKREIQIKHTIVTSTKKTISQSQRRTITEQEMDDGLPDIFDFET